ncbi:MAG: peptidylprolyl isomerase [Pseudomonadota bacterium]
MKHINYSILITLMLGCLLSTSAFAANPKVVIETTMGNIELELFEDKAPLTVKNFLAYADEGFYNGTIFHRVIKNFMIQTGGLDKDMKKKSTHSPIRNEATNKLGNLKGTIAMARTGQPHSATSQFFINTKNNKSLNYGGRGGWGYCVFGKVTKGMDIVMNIENVATKTKDGRRDVPKQTIEIKKVSLIK